VAWHMAQAGRRIQERGVGGKSLALETVPARSLSRRLLKTSSGSSDLLGACSLAWRGGRAVGTVSV
jgi:hypothetical protein